MKRVLVLCTGNSCRSQMAEGFLRHFAGDRAGIRSAGLEAHGLNPLAVKVMAEVSIDISGHTSDKVSDLDGREFDFIITVCDHANEHCPYFPGAAIRLHHSFPDPAKARGSEEQVVAEFRKVRDLICEYCKRFVEVHLK